MNSTPYDFKKPSKVLSDSVPCDRRIGRAMVGSGLASEAIEMLNDHSRERVYNALKLLSLIARAGETHPLIKTIEEHSSIDIRRAAVKLLSMSGYPELATVAVMPP